MRRRRRNSVWSFLPSASTPSTHRTNTQLKEDPLAKTLNMTLLHTRKKKKVIVSWDLCSACVLGNGSLLVSILLGVAWCLAERSQETNRFKLNQKRERKRHYLMTKKLERIKYGPKSYKERERRRDCHLKILKIPPFYKIKF